MPRIRCQRISYFVVFLVMLFLILHFKQKTVTEVLPIISQNEDNPPVSDNADQESSMIDWEDHQFVKQEELRTGPGEHGTGVSLNESEKSENQKLLNVNGFSALVSDKISLSRSIKDLRLETCRTLLYSSDLPQASIIIPFHDEHWSTLLRTVHTLIARAPAKLLHEVILVDDNSTKSFLGSQLDDYVKKTFGNVRVVRTDKREGLIRARLIGAKVAKAPVLIFIDSHCEAGLNWLPPLLQPIHENDKTVTCPFIDVIHDNDFSIVAQDEGARGAFDWKLDYKRLRRLSEDDKHPEKPFDSPIMAGGLFAISQRWFWELEGYDSGLEVWGGEQYELSFKIWMCGGTMVDTPCSRIAHVYRRFNPFGVPGKGDYVGRNYKRIAEVWMDDWKKYVYQKAPNRYLNIDPGDISQQKALRIKLNCKSFDWFMNVVAFDLVKNYPASEPEHISKGKFISGSDPTMCIDSKFGEQGDRVMFDKCVSDANSKTNGEQSFEFSWRLDIKPKGRSVCFDYPGSGRVLVLFNCHNSKGNQFWKYNLETQQLLHVISQKCIDSNIQRSEIFINDCKSVTTQQWTLEGLNKEAARKNWNESG